MDRDGDSLPGHDAEHHCLIGERSRRVYTLGDRVEVQLVEADPVAGGLQFGLLDAEGKVVKGRATPGRSTGRGPRREPADADEKTAPVTGTAVAIRGLN